MQPHRRVGRESGRRAIGCARAAVRCARLSGTTTEDTMPTDIDFLRELCAAPAPTGFEAPARRGLPRRATP